MKNELTLPFTSRGHLTGSCQGQILEYYLIVCVCMHNGRIFSFGTSEKNYVIVGFLLFSCILCNNDTTLVRV